MDNNKFIKRLDKIVGFVKIKIEKKSKSNIGSSNITAPEKLIGISKEKYIIAKAVERLSEIDTIINNKGDAVYAHIKVNDIVGLMVLLDEAITDNNTLNRTKTLDYAVKSSSYTVIDDDGEID